MDDICFVYRKMHDWDSQQFIRKFIKSDCYSPPLKLEAGHDNTFLENEFSIEPDGIHFWIKNVNARSANKIWRYQHINSYTPYAQKRSTLISTLKKVDALASGYEVRYDTAMAKLTEFKMSGYTPAMLRYACQRIGRESGHGIWFSIAKDFE